MDNKITQINNQLIHIKDVLEKIQSNIKFKADNGFWDKNPGFRNAWFISWAKISFKCNEKTPAAGIKKYRNFQRLKKMKKQKKVLMLELEGHKFHSQ